MKTKLTITISSVIFAFSICSFASEGWNHSRSVVVNGESNPMFNCKTSYCVSTKEVSFISLTDLDLDYLQQKAGEYWFFCEMKR